MSPPVVAQPAPPAAPGEQPAEESAIPTEPPAAPPPAPPPAPKEESTGLELESLVDTADIQEASDAAESSGGGMELESMIVTPREAPPPETPSPPSADAEEPMDLSLEMVEPEAVPAPPPVPEKPKTVKDSGSPTGSAPRVSDTAPARPTSGRTSGGEAQVEVVTAASTKKKKMGVFGVLARVALFFGVVLGSVAVAYPPGIQMLRELAYKIPLIGGGNGVRYLTNMLVDPVEIYVDGELFGEISADGRLEVPVRAGDELIVRILRSAQTGGGRAGDDISFALTDPMVAGDDEHYRINNQSGTVWIFAPLVSNPTGRDMMALINAGTGRARPCNCVIPAGARDYHIGYYAFEAGLRIRFVDADSDYNSRRYREVRDVTRGVAVNSGAARVTIPRR